MGKILLFFVSSAVGLSAWSVTLEGLRFNPSSRQIEFRVLYSGSPEVAHQWTLLWDSCRTDDEGKRFIESRLFLESGSDDVGQEELSQDLKFPLPTEDCRPSVIRIYFQAGSHESLILP